MLYRRFQDHGLPCAVAVASSDGVVARYVAESAGLQL